jgi:DNA replication licensing factor MCM6
MSRFDLFFIVLDECNEIVDNAIAKRIIDLHCDNLNDLQMIYKQEDIIRYINFAKHFKPLLSQVRLAEMDYSDQRLDTIGTFVGS